MKDPLPTSFPGKEKVGAVHSNYKTQMCKVWAEHNSCKFGNLCCFAHTSEDLRKLTDPMPAVPSEVLIYSPPKMKINQAETQI